MILFPELMLELEEAKKILVDRAEKYGDNTAQIGEVLSILYPHGIHPESAEDFSKFAMLVLTVVKLVRSTHGPSHTDSLRDMANYALILSILCQRENKK